MPEDKTPLYTALSRRAKGSLLRMHMPGHKGKAPFPPELSSAAALDYTELPGTGNLYEGLPPVSEAEDLSARAFGADGCYFLTGGSTQGLYAALALCCPPGSRLLLDRGSHRAVYNAMALLDLVPEYLYPRMLPGFHISGGISPEAVREALRRDPCIRCVCITSPTYYGVCSDVPAIAAVTREFGAFLVVDEAHGAHLPFLNGAPCAQGRGADISVSSAHKTLPSLGAGGLLFASGTFPAQRVRTMTALFGTSSPSYPVMASMDWARGFMEGPGREEYRRAVRTLDAVKKEIQRRGIFSVLSPDIFPENELPGITLDPARLVVNTLKGNLSGFEAARLLEEEHGIVCEMADMANVVCIVTCSDTDGDLLRLSSGFAALEARRSCAAAPPVPVLVLPEPRRSLSPREAVFSASEALPLRDALGEIAAESVSPYPPGIPVIAPGEEIDKISLNYLRQIGYNVDTGILVVRRQKEA